MRVGVIAIQGDFAKHLDSLRALGIEGLEVRTPEDLALVDRAILPGGESTTVGLLMQRFGLGDALVRASQAGMPIWGTCMGMILLARSVEGRVDQYTLGLLDIEVRRNAFGAQVHSFEEPVEFAGLSEPVLGVYIRAPIVTTMGSGVEVLSRRDDQVVAVRQGNIVGTSFHPELTDDRRVHEWFVNL
ncbi:MAG: pyridoxal 5'-phosphate synthase glutaminase subunit PdxT [Fimbriimonas sp.]